MKLLKPIQAPYVSYTGAILNETQCQAYNAMTEKCNSYLRLGLPVPDHILDGKHNLFVALAMR
jgi:hypothetical protein